jgi:hypothetical protein
MSSVTVDNIPRDRVLVNADHVDRVIQIFLIFITILIYPRFLL